MKITRLAICALVLILALSAAVLADGRYQLTLVNNSQYYPSYNGTIWSSLYSSKDVAIGPVYIRIYDTLMQTTTSCNMLCVDLLGTISWNQTWSADIAYGTPTTVIDSTAWDRVVYMAQHNTSWTNTVSTDDTLTMKIEKAAMQIAVWETIRDGDSWDINKDANMGNFALGSIWGDYSGTIKSQIAAKAYSYYTDAVANAYDGYGSTHGYYLAVNTATQDLLFFTTDFTPPPPVPEVPTMLLGSMGLTLIGIARRKFKRH